MTQFRKGQWVLVDYDSDPGAVGKPGELSGLVFFDIDTAHKMAVNYPKVQEILPAMSAQSGDRYVGIAVGPSLQIDENAPPDDCYQVDLVLTSGETWMILPHCPITSLAPAQHEDIPESRKPKIPHQHYPTAVERKQLRDGVSKRDVFFRSPNKIFLPAES